MGKVISNRTRGDTKIYHNSHVELIDTLSSHQKRILSEEITYLENQISNNKSKLDKYTNMGSATKPIYIKDGGPVECTYTLEKSVPSDAKFTDTTYSNMVGATASAAGKNGLVPSPPSGKQDAFLKGDGSWSYPVPSFSTYTLAASGWNTSAKTYSLESAYPQANYNLEIEINSTCSEAQLNAWSSAKILGSANSNILTAKGTVPTVDIPCILKIYKK